MNIIIYQATVMSEDSSQTQIRLSKMTFTALCSKPHFQLHTQRQERSEKEDSNDGNILLQETGLLFV